MRSAIAIAACCVAQIAAADQEPSGNTPQNDSIISEYAAQAAPDPEPPPYTAIRHTERYEYLADPRNRSDFFDPIKYVPLSATDPSRYVSFGGEIRERYDSFHNVGFGLVNGETEDDYWSQRVSLHADLHLNQRVRVFTQAISGLVRGEERTSSPTNEDSFDLQQAFADYVFGTPTWAGPRLTVRAGRFEMNYGSSRVVAVRSGPNIPFRFDGVQLVGASGERRVYAWLTRPVEEIKHSFDVTDRQQAFWGVYTVTPILAGGALTLDAYYLGLRNDDASYAAGDAAERRHSIGARISGSANGWSYDWEPIVQLGRFGDRDIFAWTLATDTGYRFKAPLKPRIGLKADIASGDGGSGRFGTFNPLFFRAGYFNDASLIRPANIIDIHPSIQIEPIKRFTLTAASDVIWRHRLDDALYSVPGRTLIPAGGESRYVGTTAEGFLQWKANRHVVCNVEYVHLFASRSTQALGGRDIDYAGAWITLTW